jgi:prophage maintenance system killer protein
MKRKTTKPMIMREPPSGYGESAIVIYQSPEGVRVDVKLERETVWLTQKQMSELFETERSVITKHLRNIFKSGELIEDSVSANFALTAGDGKTYQTAFYDLDAVISVGYRVNSKRGTQFRIWAASVLRDHILKGYSINERRLRELNQTIRLIADVAVRREFTGDEAKALLAVVADYSFALDLLDDYDHQHVAISGTTPGTVKSLAYDEARRIVDNLRGKFGISNLFGLEKDDSLKGALGAVMQTFDGKEVYPSIEEKAANLLYFLVKDHPFVDGNKRIGAALFLWFMEKNDALYRPDGSKCIADTAIVAMTLLIAESKPAEKDLLCRVLINLISRREP